jgi:RNA-directed DNA polymerase
LTARLLVTPARRRSAWLPIAQPLPLYEKSSVLDLTRARAHARRTGAGVRARLPVELGRGGSFGFLGFDFRRIRSRRGAWRANYTPQLKKRTALQRKLKDVFRRHQSQPVDRVVQLINPILRGWVNYFAVGHSSECFSFIKDWVEKKVRRHLAHAQKRKGFDWERWNRRWLYDTLGLFNAYRVRRNGPKVAPA